MKVKFTQLCPTLCDPMDYTVNGLLQPFPSPGDLPNPGIEPCSPALQANSLPAEPQGKPSGVGRLFVGWLVCLFLQCHIACEILVPWPGIEPKPPTLEAWSLKALDYQVSPGVGSFLSSFLSCFFWDLVPLFLKGKDIIYILLLWRTESLDTR